MTCYDVVALGDVNMDFLVAHDLSFPLSSLAENGLIHWEDIDEVPGGSGLNFCKFAAEAGYKCLLLGKTGNDSAGLAVTAWLEARKIAVPRRWTATAPTGKALVLRDSAGIRLIINNKHNANHALTMADVEENRPALASSRVVYVSGYCINDEGAARYQATLRAMAEASAGNPPPTVVFDVVPHRVYERLSFEQFRDCTSCVDILICEVATLRRFLGLGWMAEAVDEPMARATAELVSRYYPRMALRYGPSGCDHEILVDAAAGRIEHRATGHHQVADKRGYGDRLALRALTDFFRVLPATAQRRSSVAGSATPSKY